MASTDYTHDGFPETVQAYLDWRSGDSTADRTPL